MKNRRGFGWKCYKLLSIFAALCLSGCLVEPGALPDDDRQLQIEIANGGNRIVASEDTKFNRLLNSVDAVDEVDAPEPDRWHEVSLTAGDEVVVSVRGCDRLDLLDVISYDGLDARGRPDGYRYFLVCGGDSKLACGDPMVLSRAFQRHLPSVSGQYFALTGICLPHSGADPRSFIGFFKTH